MGCIYLKQLVLSTMHVKTKGLDESEGMPSSRWRSTPTPS
jgi:hypothetical protein